MTRKSILEVTGKVLKQDRAKKVTILKYKPKKRYQVKKEIYRSKNVSNMAPRLLSFHPF